MRVDAFARPVKRSDCAECRGTPSARRQPFREIACRLCVARETKDAWPSGRVWHETLEWRGVETGTANGFQAPAKPRSNERDWRGRRIRDPFVALELLGEVRAGP